MLAAEDQPRNLRIHLRGNHLNLGDEVPRGFLHVLNGKPSTKGSGRLELADALFASPDKVPLTARVMVNRIWQHHFGEGLVRTVDNFGKTGDRPSHPEFRSTTSAPALPRKRLVVRIKALHREAWCSPPPTACRASPPTAPAKSIPQIACSPTCP